MTLTTLTSSSKLARVTWESSGRVTPRTLSLKMKPTTSLQTSHYSWALPGSIGWVGFSLQAAAVDTVQWSGLAWCGPACLYTAVFYNQLFCVLNPENFVSVNLVFYSYAMKSETALKLHLVLTLLAFLSTFMTMVPMLLHVVPNSDCLLYVSNFLADPEPIWSDWLHGVTQKPLAQIKQNIQHAYYGSPGGEE